MHVLTPTAERDRAARDLAELARAALDDHWAVAAIPAERRALLLERADGAALRPGDGLGEPIADGLALLGTAYELAALGQLETALHPRTERLRRHTERRLERQGAIKTIQSAQRGKRGRHKASTRERCGRFGRF